MLHRIITTILLGTMFVGLPLTGQAQETTDSEAEQVPALTAEAGETRSAFVGQTVVFESNNSTIPPSTTPQEVLWDFGDGTRTTGEKVTHAYQRPGTFTVRLIISTDQERSEDTTEVHVFENVALLIADNSAPEDQISLFQQQAEKNDLLLLTLRPRGGGPEVLVEEELARQLVDVRDAISASNVIITWTSGSVGANVLSKLGQNIRQLPEISVADLGMEEKGIIMLSDTPYGVLAPAAQSTFDQLHPAYILLTRPQAVDLLLEPHTADSARNAMFTSPIEHRLLGTFSARTVRDIGLTNFVSFGINFLVNRGVPISNIILILMLPVIATILSFSRQIVGIKAFGLITPAMTTLSFLVLGLQYGLIVFLVVLLSGTLTRIVMRRLRLMYLPRMALVLTSVSLGMLLLLGLGVASDNANILSFSIFPVLILTLLAEEFIAVQFSSGAKNALIITSWTLLLSIACYYIVSWQLFRTLIISYPELILLAIPINIMIGRWSGLRLTEYLRFQKLIRHIA